MKDFGFFNHMYHRTKSRCKHSPAYVKKGIKFLLTAKDLQAIWIRDEADKLTRPSIDRIDTNGPYSIANCRFIELIENISRPKGYFNRKTDCLVCDKPRYKSRKYCHEHYVQWRREDRWVKEGNKKAIHNTIVFAPTP